MAQLNANAKEWRPPAESVARASVPEDAEERPTRGVDADDVAGWAYDHQAPHPLHNPLQHPAVYYGGELAEGATAPQAPATMTPSPALPPPPYFPDFMITTRRVKQKKAKGAAGDHESAAAVEEQADAAECATPGLAPDAGVAVSEGSAAGALAGGGGPRGEGANNSEDLSGEPADEGEEGEGDAAAAADGDDAKAESCVGEEGGEEDEEEDELEEEEEVVVNGFDCVDWDAEYRRILQLTVELVAHQYDEEIRKAKHLGKHAAAAAAAAVAVSHRPSGAVEAGSQPRQPVGGDGGSTRRESERPGGMNLSPSLWPLLPLLKPPGATEPPTSSPPILQPAPSTTSTTTAADKQWDAHGREVPPLTANGNRRWKKTTTKPEQRREVVQKNAFESFANALLHSVSPFMAPLRERCRTSLPHIKVDQRFGKRGAPQTAIGQFIVAPLFLNFRPRHFHDLPPGDLFEFHYDFSLVLRQISSASSISYCYGPEWKPYAIPYCYLSCKNYKQEVLSLCPDEIPNSRPEAIYEDDVIKDVTDVILAVEELETLRTMSFADAMNRRVNLSAMYDAFTEVFKPIVNYQIQIRHLNSVPSRFYLKTSHQVLETIPRPIILHGDATLWDELPVVDTAFSAGSAAPARRPNPDPAATALAAAAVAAAAAAQVPAFMGAAPAAAAPRDPPAASRSGKSEAHATVEEPLPAAPRTEALPDSPAPVEPAGAGPSPADLGGDEHDDLRRLSRRTRRKPIRHRDNGAGPNVLLVIPIAISVTCVAATVALLWRNRRL